MAKVDNPNERILGNHNLIVTSNIEEKLIYTSTLFDYVTQLIPITASTTITPDSEMVEYILQDLQNRSLMSYDNIMGNIFQEGTLILKISNPSAFSELQIQNLTLTVTDGGYFVYDNTFDVPIIVEMFNMNTDDSKIIMPFTDIDYTDYNEVIILIKLNYPGLVNIDFSRGDVIIALIE